jgi:serine/threonine protein kinase
MAKNLDSDVLRIKTENQSDDAQLLGHLAQKDKLAVISRNAAVSMVKVLNKEEGASEHDILRQLSHTNIVKLLDAYLQNDLIYLELQYSRYTLEEILGVPLDLEEIDIQHIADPVWIFNLRISFTYCSSSFPLSSILRATT